MKPASGAGRCGRLKPAQDERQVTTFRSLDLPPNVCYIRKPSEHVLHKPRSPDKRMSRGPFPEFSQRGIGKRPSGMSNRLCRFANAGARIDLKFTSRLANENGIHASRLPGKFVDDKRANLGLVTRRAWRERKRDLHHTPSRRRPGTNGNSSDIMIH